jgi:UDP-N-acetylmuramate--alanine ligase
LHVPGVHNVLNATAAIAVGTALDIPVDQIRSALDGFRGVDRRFQLKGNVGGVSVIDDYGHHPTEIRATLAAARQCGFRRVHVIFQPHRFTRTRDLMDEFATAFADADTLCLLDIYPASEKPIEGITAATLVNRIAGAGKRGVAYAPSFSDAVVTVAALAEPGDMVLTLGAGSVSQLGAMILQKLEAKSYAPRATR